MKIAVIGYKGKMGSTVYELLGKYYSVVGVDKDDEFDINVDLVVDFSSSENSNFLLDKCTKNKIPLIIGTTGHDEKELLEIKNASKFIPVFKAGNFSTGMQNLKNSLKNLITIDTQDVIIFEKHHRNKKDAPSGTAKEIEQFITNKFNIEPSVIYERGGKEIGTHIIDIYYENEVVSVSHQAFSRIAFAEGVKKAVEFMINVKDNGLYGMADIKL